MLVHFDAGFFGQSNTWRQSTIQQAIQMIVKLKLLLDPVPWSRCIVSLCESYKQLNCCL